jgi:c-di-GMP-binding flagellar brake protein YcgR
MNNLSSYAIQNQRQISSHLFLLIKNRCLLNASFGINGKSYITTLLDVNEKNDTLTFDCGPDDDINNKILNASQVRFETQLRGIQVWFTGTALKNTSYKGDQAFVIPMPKKLFWMQRRDSFRVRLPPLSNLSYCHLIGKDSKPTNIKIHDLSLSGFSTIDNHKEVFNQMILGALFQQVRLKFLDEGEDKISFEVCYNQIINPHQLQKVHKIGCKFTQMTPLVEDAIQRYLLQLQREYLKGPEF